MRALEWGYFARADLLSIIDYIADENPDAAEVLLTSVERKVSQLARFPAMGREGRVAGTRELVVHQNYVVVYQVRKESVKLLRVLHVARQWPPI